MQRLQLGARRKPQVLCEALDEVAIRLACARALPAAREPRHVRAQCGFIQRVGVEQPRRQVDASAGIDVGGQGVSAASRQATSQAVAFEAEPARPRFALIVVKSGEQFAAAHRERIGDTLFAQRRLEGEHIGLGFEAKGSALRLDPRAPSATTAADAASCAGSCRRAWFPAPARAVPPVLRARPRSA